MPIYNSLVGDTIVVVQNFEDLRECFHDTSVFVTIDLYDINESDLGFCISTKWF